MTGMRVRPGLRFAVSMGLLAVLWHLTDGHRVLDQLGNLEAGFALAALAVTVPQVALSAWRWHFAALRLGLCLPFRQAFVEYYLATFLNQVLPGGIAGDAARALRHGRSEARGIGAAARAVILERASGQIALIAVVLCALILERDVFPAIADRAWFWSAWLIPAVAIAVFVTRKGPWRRGVETFLIDSKTVFSGWSGGIQLMSSLCVVATYLTVYGLAGRSVGVELSTGALMTVVPLILFSMVLPVSVSGWGVREAAAAASAASAGLTPDSAVAVSIAYGLIVLVSSLPGLFVLLMLRPGEETRTSAATGR